MTNEQELLTLALKGLHAEREKIDQKISELERRLRRRGTPHAEASAQPAATRKRRMSAAARKKISEAMKRRHAEMKKGAKKSA